MSDPLIQDIAEIHNGRMGDVDDKGVRNYVRVFRVVTTLQTHSILSVLYLSVAPQPWDSYVEPDGLVDEDAFLKKLSAHQEDEDWFTWIVTAEYSTKLNWPDYGIEDPTQRATEIFWGGNKFTRPCWQDNQDRAILNSARCYFDPPPEIEDFRFTLKMVKNWATWDPNIIGQYVCTVNDDAWYGFQPGEVKCVDISAERGYEKGIFYWKVSYQFECKPGFGATAWAAVLLDQGYQTLWPSDGTLMVARDTHTGATLTAPALLDGFGQQLAPGASPVFLTYYIYDNAIFSLLNIP